MSRKAIEGAFPRLGRTNYSLTSPDSVEYNCVAWAAGDTSRFWWPFERPLAYWPPGVDRRVELEAFVEAFKSIGYEECADGNLEAGCEKVALFADANGVPTHAARQLPGGRWTSKLGQAEDIEHNIYGLEGGAYGEVTCYVKRTR